MTEVEMTLRKGAADAVRAGEGPASAYAPLADWLMENGREEEGLALAKQIFDGTIKPDRQANRWPDPAEALVVTDHQKAALGAATLNPLGVLVGTPGTGKTLAAANYAALCSWHGRTAVCAPTGKAAVRFNQALQLTNYRGHRATTIHQLLRIGRSGRDGNGWNFDHNRSNPLNLDFLFIDEGSLLGTELAADLFDAIRPGTHVMLVGDVFQLPPVGHGAPLRDLMASGIALGELTELHRNAGDIVKVCAAIRAGRDWEPSLLWDEDLGYNLRHIEAPTPAAQIEAALSVLRRFRDREEFDPANDVQIICAVNAKSPLSKGDLNKIFQGMLNPPSGGTGRPAVGDKIMCTLNGFYGSVSGGHRGEVSYVANGEIGIVSDVVSPHGHPMYEFDDPKRMVYRVGAGLALDDDASETVGGFHLAYAATGHKLQGSEFPVTIVFADDSPGARMVCDAHWWYTSFSRARRLCISIGRLKTIKDQCQRVTLYRRRTRLKELIRED